RRAQPLDRLDAESAVDGGVVEQLEGGVQAPARQLDDLAQARLHLLLGSRVLRHRRDGAGDRWRSAPRAHRSGEAKPRTRDGKVAACRSKTISSQRVDACSPTITARPPSSWRAGRGARSMMSTGTAT